MEFLLTRGTGDSLTSRRRSSMRTTPDVPERRDRDVVCDVVRDVVCDVDREVVRDVDREPDRGGMGPWDRVCR